MTLLATLLLSTPAAHATIDPQCVGKTQRYDDEGQQNFMLNYFALATTFSPLHGAVPGQPGHGDVGLELSAIPPLSCEQRLVLNSTKTEDTNKAPVLPRPRLRFVFPKVGPLVPYAGLAYVPPVTVFGIRNVIVSGEVGAGLPLEMGLELGARYHFTLMKTIGEIATPFVEGDPVYDDFYMGSTFGADLLASYPVAWATPYVALGFTDVSTYFYVGDDGYVGNNTDPFFGFTGSLGVQARPLTWLDVSAEFYTAPGFIYTGRLMLAVHL